jgi:hypothetical protein
MEIFSKRQVLLTKKGAKASKVQKPRGKKKPKSSKKSKIAKKIKDIFKKFLASQRKVKKASSSKKKKLTSTLPTGRQASKQVKKKKQLKKIKNKKPLKKKLTTAKKHKKTTKISRVIKVNKNIKPSPQKIKQLKIGIVTHFFPNVNAAVIKLRKELCVGDVVYIKGETTDFNEKVISMQINNKPIEKANKSDEIGLKVKKRVRAGDIVYKKSIGM